MSVRIGALCFRAENFERTWLNAMAHCANLDMRAPTLGEAFELAQTHDLLNVDTAAQFWTSDRDLWSQLGGSVQIDAHTMDDAGDFGFQDTTDDPAETVCVTTPTN